MTDSAFSPPTARELACFALSLACVVGIGLTNLDFPFASDQGLVLQGALSIERGGVLYVDFWDNKMPALFWFYWAAGKLFGFDERGLHTFELIYLSLFAVVLMATMRRELRPRWLAALTPISVIAVYYVAALSLELLQLEMISAFPIYLSLWCASRCAPMSARSSRFGFLSGVFAGVTVCFKLVFAPLFVTAWFATAWYLYHHRDRSLTGADFVIRLLKVAVVPVAAGLASILGLVVLKFWLDDGLPALLWTAFDYPVKALELITPATTQRKLETISYFLSFYLAWSGFIAVAIAHWWGRHRDLWTGLLIVWLVIGAVVIGIQRFSWWTYHALILFAPAGLLGVKGLAVALAWTLDGRPHTRRHVAVVALLLCLPPVAALAVPARDKVRALVISYLETKGSVLDYQITVRPKYRFLQQTTAFLRGDRAASGSIYVFGDPLYYYFSGREPAAPIPGYAWGYFLPSQWAHLAKQLAQADPPYIYVQFDHGKTIVKRGAGVWDFMKANYQLKSTDKEGSWFERRSK